MSIKPLTQKAMIVTLSISQWLARIKDNEAADSIWKSFGTKKSAGTYTKRLIPLKGAMLQVNSAISAVKRYHEDRTLPWGRGQRILMSSKWPAYSKKIRKLTTEFDNAVLELEVEFPNLQKDAEDLMGQLYKESDYPTNSISTRYNISITPSPIPEEGDWRITLSEESLKELKDETRKQEEARLENAMNEAWMKIYRPVKHMVEVLSKDKPKIYETLVTNVTDLVKMLPDLNFAEDPKLEEMRKEIEGELCDMTADQLRDSKYLRRVALEAAEKLRQKIKEEGGIEDEDVLEMISNCNEVIERCGKPVYEQTEMDNEL